MALADWLWLVPCVSQFASGCASVKRLMGRNANHGKKLEAWMETGGMPLCGREREWVHYTQVYKCALLI